MNPLPWLLLYLFLNRSDSRVPSPGGFLSSAQPPQMEELLHQLRSMTDTLEKVNGLARLSVSPQADPSAFHAPVRSASAPVSGNPFAEKSISDLSQMAARLGPILSALTNPGES